MRKSTERVALLREQRRQQGLKETTIWLSPEDDELLAGIVKKQGLRSRSEGIRYALKAFNQETRT